MPRRNILTDRQRAVLFDLPMDETALLRHYTLADDDLEIIRARRRPHNRFGFALQLCALRYPGRLLAPGEVIPEAVTRFLAAQLGLRPDDLADYATREETRREHLSALREVYGYKMFTGRGSRDLKAWLESEAETARSNEYLARRFVEHSRATQTILPGVTVIERFCADALVAAERRIDDRIVGRLDGATRDRLDALLTEDAGGTVTRFVWLRQFEVGQNSADMNRLLDRLEFLRGIALDKAILADVPPHRVARLRRQGERYFAGDLRDISGDRRLAILAVCALEWRSAIADAVVETHDRIVGKTWREAKSRCDTRRDDAKAALKDTLQAFSNLGSALLEAHEDQVSLDEAVRNTPRLAMPFEPEAWLADRKGRMSDALRRLARAAKAGAIPGGSIEDGVLKIDRLTAAVPEEAEAMVLDLYARLPGIVRPLPGANATTAAIMICRCCRTPAPSRPEALPLFFGWR